MSQHQYESCGMPIETGIHCPYCVGEDGKLPPFEEHFDRMVAWWTGQHPDLSLDEAWRQTLAYMGQMPAWRDHPKVKVGFPRFVGQLSYAATRVFRASASFSTGVM